MATGPGFPPADFRPLCSLQEGHAGPHDFVTRLALRNRLRAEKGRCPDDGTCHHGCHENYGGACWRVFNAGPLSAAHFPNDEWPELIRQAEQHSILTNEAGDPRAHVLDLVDRAMVAAREAADQWNVCDPESVIKPDAVRAIVEAALGITVEEQPELGPERTTVYVRIKMTFSRPDGSEYERTLSLDARAETEEHAPTQQDGYAAVASLRAAADAIEGFMSGPPVDETTSAVILEDVSMR
jgi:hypothetical protein